MYFGLGVGLRIGCLGAVCIIYGLTAKRSKRQVLRSTTTNTMTSLLRGLIGSGGQAEEPTGVETVRANLSNCNCTYGKLEKFQE